MMAHTPPKCITEPSFGFPLGVLEVRYLRKAVRYRMPAPAIGTIGRRQTPPSGKNTTRGITLERRRELDEIADWFVQEEC
jgi:hypothetical protein